MSNVFWLIAIVFLLGSILMRTGFVNMAKQEEAKIQAARKLR
jgi:hypothetical protein